MYYMHTKLPTKYGVLNFKTDKMPSKGLRRHWQGTSNLTSPILTIPHKFFLPETLSGSPQRLNSTFGRMRRRHETLHKKLKQDELLEAEAGWHHGILAAGRVLGRGARLGRVLAASWPRLGRVLAASWPRLGRVLAASKAASWSRLGRVLVLVASWSRLGRVLVASWSRLGVSWPCLGRVLASWSRLESRLESRLGRVLVAESWPWSRSLIPLFHHCC